MQTTPGIFESCQGISVKYRKLLWSQNQTIVSY